MLRTEYVTVVTNGVFLLGIGCWVLGAGCWVLGIGSLRQFINRLNDPTFFAFRKKKYYLCLHNS